MRWYFTAMFIIMMLVDLVIYKYDGSLALIIITGIIGVLNLLAALIYNAITEIYKDADDMDNM
jgi:succinate-acetate transporter protein